jgi:hypothetical protein
VLAVKPVLGFSCGSENNGSLFARRWNVGTIDGMLPVSDLGILEFGALFTAAAHMYQVLEKIADGTLALAAPVEGVRCSGRCSGVDTHVYIRTWKYPPCRLALSLGQRSACKHLPCVL